MTPEERADRLERKIRELIGAAHELVGSAVDLSRFDLTPDEAAGDSRLSMPAVYWPRRWLTDTIRAAVAEERVRCATVVQRWRGPPSKTGMVRAIVEGGEPGDPAAGYDPILARQAATVDRFAAEIRARIVENRAKGDWAQAPPLWLFARALQEIGELVAAMRVTMESGTMLASADEVRATVRREAADAAAVLMMVADVLGAFQREEEPAAGSE